METCSHSTGDILGGGEGNPRASNDRCNANVTAIDNTDRGNVANATAIDNTDPNVHENHSGEGRDSDDTKERHEDTFHKQQFKNSDYDQSQKEAYFHQQPINCVPYPDQIVMYYNAYPDPIHTYGYYPDTYAQGDPLTFHNPYQQDLSQSTQEYSHMHLMPMQHYAPVHQNPNEYSNHYPYAYPTAHVLPNSPFPSNQVENQEHIRSDRSMQPPYPIDNTSRQIIHNSEPIKNKSPLIKPISSVRRRRRRRGRRKRRLPPAAISELTCFQKSFDQKKETIGVDLVGALDKVELESECGGTHVTESINDETTVGSLNSTMHP